MEQTSPAAFYKRREFLARTAAVAGAASLASVLPAETLIAQAATRQVDGACPSPSNMPIDTFVVLMMENRSFDHYFGWHQDADGKNRASAIPTPSGNQVPTHRLDARLPGLRLPRPRPRLGRRPPPVQRRQARRLRHRQPGGRRQRRVRRRLLPEGGPRLHPARRRAVHALRPLVLLDHGLDLPEPPLPVGRAERRAEVATILPPQTERDRLHRGRRSSTAPSRSGVTRATYYNSDLPFAALYGARGLSWMQPIAQFYAQAAAGTLPNICFVDPPFKDGGGGDGHLRRRAPARRRAARAGLHVRRRPRLHGVAAVPPRRDVHQLRRVGRLLRPRQAAASSPTSGRTARTWTRTGASPASASPASRSRPSRAAAASATCRSRTSRS